MMTLDEATRARVAAAKLLRLYHAYRATARAQGLVLQRMSAGLATTADIDDAERIRLSRRLGSDLALSRENDLVFAERVEQLRRRIEELEEFRP